MLELYGPAKQSAEKLWTKGTASAVPSKATALRALALRYVFAAAKGAEVLGRTKKFARNYWKNVPQELKPYPIRVPTARLKPCPSCSELFRSL
jgi:hypothetical protein